MKTLFKSLAVAAMLLASHESKAESSCVINCSLSLDTTTFQSYAWTGNTNGIVDHGGGVFDGIAILSSGQPCNGLTGPTINIFMAAPATNDITIGTVTITCHVGMIYQKTSQPIQLQVAQGSQFASFQIFACQCDGQGACAVCACRNGTMYTPPANQGPQQ